MDRWQALADELWSDWPEVKTEKPEPAKKEAAPDPELQRQQFEDFAIEERWFDLFGPDEEEDDNPYSEDYLPKRLLTPEEDAAENAEMNRRVNRAIRARERLAELDKERRATGNATDRRPERFKPKLLKPTDIRTYELRISVYTWMGFKQWAVICNGRTTCTGSRSRCIAHIDANARPYDKVIGV